MERQNCVFTERQKTWDLSVCDNFDSISKRKNFKFNVKKGFRKQHNL